MVNSTPRIIVYHADCLDGAACAWTMAQYLGLSGQERHVLYVPYNHHNIATSENTIREARTPQTAIHFVDVAPTVRFLNELSENGRAASIEILDHHKTAATRFQQYPAAAHVSIHIDPATPSAVAMIWRKLYPERTLPDLFKMIDKMDGSARGLKTEDDFSAAAMIDARNIRTVEQAFASLPEMIQTPLPQMVAEGRHLVATQDQKIDALFETAAEARVIIDSDETPVSIPVVNADVTDYGRGISARLAELGKIFGTGMAMAWTERPGGAVSVSLRSDGEPDVSKIADYLAESLNIDGGGHADAAAIHFETVNDFMKWANIQPA